MQDPRIKNVTVTRAEVSGDLQHAKVFVSIMGSDKEQDLCMHGLKRSAGYVQSKLGSRLKTRFTPSVRFVKDEGVKQSIEITRLIHEAMAQSRTEELARAAESGMAGDAGADEELEEA